MNKIGAHNAATGEKGSFWSKPLTLFARCQSKTLMELYDAGVRLFDIRVRLHKDGKLYIHHGPWRSKENVFSVLLPLMRRLEQMDETNDPVYFEITYEGSTVTDEAFEAMTWLGHQLVCHGRAVVTRINRKTPWEAIETYYPLAYDGDGVGFKGVHGWRCLLPIPWLWAKIHSRVEFNDKTFIYTDFV